MIAAGLPLRCVTLRRPGLRHARRPGERLPDDLAAHRRRAARLPARPRVARHRRPRPRARLERVRAAGGGERLRGTDHGAAGVGLLIGSRVRGQMLGEFPGLAPAGSTSRATCGRPPTSAPLYCSLLEQWFATDAAAGDPQRGDLHPRHAPDMKRPALAALATFVLVAVPGTAGAYPTRVQAVADEFTLTLSRLSVPNKRVKIELANFGEDPHDLRLRRIGGTRTFVIPETLPGERTTRTFDLGPGATASGARSPITTSRACGPRCASAATKRASARRRPCARSGRRPRGSAPRMSRASPRDGRVRSPVDAS